MKRLAIAVLLALPMMLATAPGALAAQPTIQREAIDDTRVDTSCGFPVQVHTTGFVITIQWVDADGTTRTIQAFPQAKDTLTNLDTGTSIMVNISGLGISPRAPTAASPWSARACGDGGPDRL